VIVGSKRLRWKNTFMGLLYKRDEVPGWGETIDVELARAVIETISLPSASGHSWLKDRVW